MDTAKEIKINIPEGYEVDKKNSTFECIKFKPVKKQLPKTWEEYCSRTRKKFGDSWIDEKSNISTLNPDFYSTNFKDPVYNKNILPSRKYAEAMLALCQLIQLRDCYNNRWEPKWRDTTQKKYCIHCEEGAAVIVTSLTNARVLRFKTKTLCKEFFKNFRDLIETAKPLL